MVFLAFNAGAQSPALLDLDGKQIHPLSPDAPSTVVIVFLRTDCPISNRYAPELLRLQKQFKEARFWWVYPNDEAAAIEKHIKEYGYHRADVLRDPQQTLVKLIKAQVTPEAAVFFRRQLVYRGRIDDRVVAFGKQRPQPRQRELEATLNAAMRGAKLKFKEQPGVGCYIVKTHERADEK